MPSKCLTPSRQIATHFYITRWCYEVLPISCRFHCKQCPEHSFGLTRQKCTSPESVQGQGRYMWLHRAQTLCKGWLLKQPSMIPSSMCYCSCIIEKSGTTDSVSSPVHGFPFQWTRSDREPTASGQSHGEWRTLNCRSSSTRARPRSSTKPSAKSRGCLWP